MAGSGTAHLRDAGASLLRAEHLVVEFPVGSTGLKVNAVSDVSLDILPGETLGLVGESGSGKSTTGRALMQMPRPNAGTVVLGGATITELGSSDLRELRPRMQMIFQDPISSLNPRRRVGDIVGDPPRNSPSSSIAPSKRSESTQQRHAIVVRMSSPVASASASASPVRSCSNRSSSSATSPSRRSMSRCRLRFSTSSRT